MPIRRRADLEPADPACVTFENRSDEIFPAPARSGFVHPRRFGGGLHEMQQDLKSAVDQTVKPPHDHRHVRFVAPVHPRRLQPQIGQDAEHKVFHLLRRARRTVRAEKTRIEIVGLEQRWTVRAAKSHPAQESRIRKRQPTVAPRPLQAVRNGIVLVLVSFLHYTGLAYGHALVTFPSCREKRFSGLFDNRFPRGESFFCIRVTGDRG